MFSKNARWDRHLPHQNREAEPIEVAVVFKKGKIVPKAFKWNDRKYHIEQITYQWVDKRGAEVLHYFTVTSGGNVYQIYLNSKYMYWRLEKVCNVEE